mgnify:CR=1 FL=1
MSEQRIEINNRNYLKYKFFNSLFLGAGIGSYISQYQPIKISEIAILGIIFAFLSLFIAKIYHKIIYKKYFFQISLFVELVMVFWMLFFLFFPFSYKIALLIYVARSLTFLFGDYLQRSETYLLKKKKIFSFIDVNRQIGIIVGMVFAVIYYYILEEYFQITENQKLVYYIHFILFGVECMIIYFLLKSFRKAKTN